MKNQRKRKCECFETRSSINANRYNINSDLTLMPIFPQELTKEEAEEFPLGDFLTRLNKAREDIAKDILENDRAFRERVDKAEDISIKEITDGYPYRTIVDFCQNYFEPLCIDSEDKTCIRCKDLYIDEKHKNFVCMNLKNCSTYEE